MNKIPIICLIDQATIDRLNAQFGLKLKKPEYCEEVYVTRNKREYSYEDFKETRRIMQEIPKT